MSIKKRLEGKSAGVGEGRAPSSATTSVDAIPRTAPGQLMAFRGLMQETEAQLEALRNQVNAATSIEAALTDLHEIEGRRRQLSPNEYEELKENLRHNPLVSPLTVRRREEGGYELISGHNRLAAFRDLGRDRVPVFIVDADDEQADLSAFYANLLQPSLPDFSKFEGFKRRQSATKKTQKELAQEAGIDPSRLSRIMAFEGLPKDALALLQTSPGILGCDAAAALAKLTRDGRGKAVVASIRLLVAGEITQEAAVRTVAQDGNPPPSPRPQPFVIRSGKSTFCKIVAASKTLRLEFGTEEEREKLGIAITELVQDFAQKRNE